MLRQSGWENVDWNDDVWIRTVDNERLRIVFRRKDTGGFEVHGVRALQKKTPGIPEYRIYLYAHPVFDNGNQLIDRGVLQSTGRFDLVNGGTGDPVLFYVEWSAP